jgi:alpha-amylase
MKFSQTTYRFLLIVIVCNALSIRVIAQTDNWWDDAVFYEVFVRSFKDSDGDGNGDIRGLINQLDYLNDGDSTTRNDLGVTALWLMPIQESPSYHGYDVTNYRQIEPDYGTNDDFKELMEEAHKRGIKVIVDYVMNHTSDKHPWFVESKDEESHKRDWYTWEQPAPDFKGPWGQTVWHYRNAQFFYGVFWNGMPDLNYEGVGVKDTMFDIASFWLNDMGVDGFRLDAIKYIYEDGSSLEDLPQTISFWKEFRTHYKSQNPNALGVGEAWTTTSKVVPYVSDGGLDFCFEFDVADGILYAAKTGVNSRLTSKLNTAVSSYEPSQYGTFITNHDMNRVMDQVGFDEDKARVAANLLLTLPGVPFIYYGEEIGMIGSKPDEDIRRPMQWNGEEYAGFSDTDTWRDPHSDYHTRNVELQQNDAKSLWTNYRDLIYLRNHHEALRKGDYGSVSSTSSRVFAFLRQTENETILVVANNGTTVQSDVTISLTESSISSAMSNLIELRGGEGRGVTIDENGAFELSFEEVPAQTCWIYKFSNEEVEETSVLFRVDMHDLINAGGFDPNTETVDISGSFNSFGTTTTSLTDENEDGIYEVELDGFAVGSTQSYKYRIDAGVSGKEEFVGTDYYRDLLIMEGKNAVTDQYQNEAINGLSSHYVTAGFPNPVRKDFYLELNAPAQVAIMNSFGQTVETAVHPIGKFGYRFEFSDVPSGVYKVIIDGDQGRETKRIIKL